MFYGVLGFSGVAFAVTKAGYYQVTAGLAGTVSYSVSSQLSGPTNGSSPPVAEAYLAAGLRIRDSNASRVLGGGSWNDHAKSCGNRHGWYCILALGYFENRTGNVSSANVPVALGLKWWSGSLERLVAGETYLVGSSVEFRISVTGGDAAAGSVLSASLAFNLHYTNITVRGPV